ncbi:hypothetical protein RRG08_062039 [Elysia crispata]|uniref:Uncharacterized protein n=1 Tax=Elysia crispata TaxID=231223 RepID=A0AAE1DSV4_9GAST|nr:hypothetical protein RRG08_062039 [Elysia crispata]
MKDRASTKTSTTVTSVEPVSENLPRKREVPIKSPLVLAELGRLLTFPSLSLPSPPSSHTPNLYQPPPLISRAPRPVPQSSRRQAEHASSNCTLSGNTDQILTLATAHFTHTKPPAPPCLSDGVSNCWTFYGGVIGWREGEVWPRELVRSNEVGSGSRLYLRLASWRLAISGVHVFAGSSETLAGGLVSSPGGQRLESQVAVTCTAAQIVSNCRHSTADFASTTPTLSRLRYLVTQPHLRRRKNYRQEQQQAATITKHLTATLNFVPITGGHVALPGTSVAGPPQTMVLSSPYYRAALPDIDCGVERFWVLVIHSSPSPPFITPS